MILDAALEAFVSIDAAGRITAWNAAAELTFGWSREEIVGRSLVDTIIPAEYRDAHLRGLARYLSTREGTALNRRLELEALDRSGRVFPVEMTISPLCVDGETSFNAFVHDISERRDAEASLRRLAKIVDHIPDAILVASSAGAVIDCNPAAERLFGWSRDEIAGQSPDVLIPAHLGTETRELWQRALTGETIAGVETQRLRHDGSTVHVEMTLMPMSTTDGETIGSAIYRDITGRKRAENDLAAHTARLQALAARERAGTPTMIESHHPELQDHHLVERTLGLVSEHLGMDVAWLSEFAGDQLVFQAIDGDRAAFGLTEGDAVAAEGTMCQRMRDGRIPNAISDTRLEPSVRDLPHVVEGTVRAWIGVPVTLSDGNVYGTLCAASRHPEPHIGDDEVGFLRVLAGLLADQLERERREEENNRLQAELTGVSALLAALDARDHYTSEHSHAVVSLARRVAERLGLEPAHVTAVEQVALLHDLGKVGVPDAVLQKPDKLTEAEWELMREHPAIGARIVASISSLAHLAAAVRAEHERWDGRGYPDRLKGQDIPIAARITFACDAYHAMTSDRPYRRSIGHLAACRELTDGADSQFDPDVVNALLQVLPARGAESDEGTVSGDG